MKTNSKLVLVFSVLILVLGIISVPRIFAVLQPVKSIEIFSKGLDYTKKTPGSWKIDKSAEWVSKGVAEITFDVDSIIKQNPKNRDILFVLDVSGSMEGTKLNKVKSDASELITTLLSNEKNKAGLITFDSTSEIVVDFTSDKNLLLDKVSGLVERENTNYYQALKNVDTVLSKYTPDKDSECIVLFLTDGFPNEETPNEVGQYNYLKSQYPFITINGVQYEMGLSILNEIKQISDNQYIANIKTLNNVLFEASDVALAYENFNISDYINTDYFVVDSEEDIKVSRGSIKFDSDLQKIDWTIEDFKSGSSANMKIKARLKDEYVGNEGLYPTNKKEEVKSKIDDDSEDITTSDTPILSAIYEVVYDGNAPDDCNISNVPDSARHASFDIVGISENIPVCSGYQFKGWEIVTENVTKTNRDYFVMPSNNVEIRGKWSKLGVSKSMDGSVQERLTLYKQVQADVLDSNKFAKEYEGDTSTFNGKEKVYYYYGEAKNNNVIFGNYCWKIVRTTDTGGVKIIYNGLPTEDGRCNNIGAASALSQEQIGVSGSDAEVRFNDKSDSPSFAGYMYNENYSSNRIDNWKDGTLYKFGNSFTYVDGVYTLTDTVDVTDTSDKTLFSNHHYTCFNDTGVCSELKYVYSYYSYGDFFSYINLANGKNIDSALKEMITDDNINQFDSTIKKSIDYWYENNMIEYTKYLEDTVWCNDRSIDELGGWNPNGGSILDGLSFYSAANSRNLICLKKSDKFTVDEKNGNGKLKYPTSLITRQEINLSYRDLEVSPLAFGDSYWTLTPYAFSDNLASGFYVLEDGFSSVIMRVNMFTMIKPAISLRAGIQFTEGDGSSEHPYLIEMT
ncbi:MAG: VWA domain-containing protein [Bacilli bacterium]|nr:VWA domain-containing protein [Bacilli bacterium]